MDVVTDAKATARSGERAMLIWMGIEMITKMVFKRGEKLGCDIAVVKSVDRILPTPMDFMLIGSVILYLSPCHLTTTTGICQGILMVFQLALEPLKKTEQAPQTNSVWILLK